MGIEEKLRKHEASEKSHDWTQHRNNGGRNQLLTGDKSKIINSKRDGKIQNNSSRPTD